jgi:hypothetical protein
MASYTQCKLERDDVVQVSWIPSRHAQLGKVLQLFENGDWIDGWVVKETWQTVDETELPDSHAERKAHKRATGDTQE